MTTSKEGEPLDCHEEAQIGPFTTHVLLMGAR